MAAIIAVFSVGSVSLVSAKSIGQVYTHQVNLETAGYDNVELSNTASSFTVNGVVLTTGALVGEDYTLTGDMVVGDDLTVTGLATIAETLATAGNSYFGAAGYVSTNTAASGAWAMPATLNVVGAATLDSTLDVDGNVTVGAAGFRSTNTASSGAWAMPATLNVAGAVTLDSTLDVDGNFITGAATFRSTNTASSGAWAFPATVSIAGAVTGPTSITATKFVANGAGSVGLYSRSASQIVALTPAAAGQIYFCNDCTLDKVCISTGTGAGAFVGVSSFTVVCQ